MAQISQGTTVTWKAVVFKEVVSVSVDGAQANTVEITPRTALRSTRYSVADIDSGSVTVVARGTTNMQMTNVGTTALLSISSPGVSWIFATAIFEKLNWQASTGELQTFSVTFKLGD